MLGMAILATGFVACSSDDGTTTENVEESQTTTMSVKSSSLKYERETMNFIDEFYKGNYVMLSTETITDDSGEEYEVTKISKDGIESEHLVKVLSENKMVFADKNDRTGKLTAFDLDFSQEGVTFDFEDEKDYRTVKGKKWGISRPLFKGWFKKIWGSGDDECQDDNFSIEPGCVLS